MQSAQNSTQPSSQCGLEPPQVEQPEQLKQLEQPDQLKQPVNHLDQPEQPEQPQMEQAKQSKFLDLDPLPSLLGLSASKLGVPYHPSFQSLIKSGITPKTLMFSEEIGYFRLLSEHRLKWASSSVSEIFTPIQNAHYHWIASKIVFNKAFFTPHYNGVKVPVSSVDDNLSTSSIKTPPLQIDVPICLSNLSHEILSSPYVPPDSIANLLQHGVTPLNIFSVEEWYYKHSLDGQQFFFRQFLGEHVLTEEQFFYHRYLVSKSYFVIQIFTPAYLEHCKNPKLPINTSSTVQVEPFEGTVPHTLAKLSIRVLQQPYNLAVELLLKKSITPDTFISPDELTYYEQLSAYQHHWQQVTGNNVLTKIQRLHLKATASKLHYKTTIFIPAFALLYPTSL